MDELLGVLGLEACSEVRVGNPLERGISGGEARRLSMGIGVADLESVRLLLLDEPTTVRLLYITPAAVFVRPTCEKIVPRGG